MARTFRTAAAAARGAAGVLLVLQYELQYKLQGRCRQRGSRSGGGDAKLMQQLGKQTDSRRVCFCVGDAAVECCFVLSCIKP